MNTPYVKAYDSKGEIANPITKNNPYVSGASKRKDKRAYLNKERFYGNGKNHPLTVLRTEKYLRFIQETCDKLGKRKFIYHYLLQ